VARLVSYGTYVTNFKAACNLLDSLEETEKFCTFEKEISRKYQFDGTMELRSLLSLPLNHISQYVRYIEVLASCTEFDPVDELLAAYSILEKTSQFLHDELEAAVQRLKINAIEEKVLGFEGSLNVTGRKYVAEGSATRTRRKK
jgi:hypothetical protein